ncbi:MAG: DegT/DnrJ/EryC1/StrS family aminotransferase [archaeon]
MNKIEWSPPDMGSEEKEAAKRIIDSGWMTQGKETEKLESEICKYIGCKYAVVVNNGTSALIAALMAHGVGYGDEVIVPTFTFIASVNAILAVGAKPVLVDCDLKTFNTTPEIVRKAITKKTKAIMPVDVAGMPVDMNGFLKLAKEKNIIIIEDAAEAIGAEYENKKIGSFNHTSILSFHMAKLAAGIEGGCILTSDKTIAEKCLLLRNHGMKQKFVHSYFGLNLRITDIQSAIIRVQLKKINQYLDWRNKLANQYKNELKNLVKYQEIPKYVTKHPYMIFNIVVKTDQQKKLIKSLDKNKIGNRISWIPTHEQPHHKKIFKDSFPNSKILASQIISLPMGNILKEEEVSRVCQVIKDTIGDDN